ncbi:phosphate/phosphite/phosphonate ABC transporter substrate-binding protein [Photobacterium proteolyticum]|nr:phosphate/phosphite/phosphonate ABC transporter substrate-binding protein [Photobacterium proteolyticum]
MKDVQLCRVMIYRALCLTLLFVGIEANAATESQTGSSLSSSVLTVGVISTNPKKQYKFIKPMADYLASNLHAFGIEKGEVIVARNTAQMMNLLEQGKVDVLSETVFTASKLVNESNAELLLLRWKKGVEKYRSVFFVRKDSGIKSLSDLLGKTIAFEDRSSTSAFYIPASILLQSGFELQELKSPRELPDANRVGYLFSDEMTASHNEVNISSWVCNGVIMAGAFSDLNWNDEEDLPSQMREEMNIIHQSPSFPRSVVLIRSGIDNGLKKEIQQLLLGANDSEAGKAALRRYQSTAKFTHLNSDALDGIAYAKQLREIVEQQLVP